jgi:molybdenum cofactor biosynthesis enzyme MoaA
MGINRDKTRHPHTKTWCEHCDRARISPGNKCLNCGLRQGPLKRPPKKSEPLDHINWRNNYENV